LKIVSIGPAFPFRGGIARFNESLASGLQNEGHEVLMVSFTVQYPTFLFPGKSQKVRDALPPPVTVVQLIHSFNPFSWLRTARKIKDFRPNVVIFHYWMPFFAPSFGCIARRITSGKDQPEIVMIAHNLIPHERQVAARMLTRFALARADKLVCLSESVASEGKTMLPAAKVKVLFHPVYDSYGDAVPADDARQMLKLPAARNIFLFFGLVRAYKGLDLLISALEKIRDEDFLLLVAGEFYGDKEKYLAQIKSAGLEEKVIVRDEYIPDAEVKYYFSAASLVVQPYRTATQSGVSQIAVHFEKPMLVTNVGGLPDMVRNGITGIVVDPDPAAVAEGIKSFITTGEPAAMKSHLRQLRLDWSWQAFSGKLIDLL
jgi:glycosyltransferase involved in cell wall biosynthesis